MENQTTPTGPIIESTRKSPLFTVTRVSKYLALLLFISLPFIGGLVGYNFAPQQEDEVAPVIVNPVPQRTVVEPANEVWKVYTNNAVGISFGYPSDWSVGDEYYDSSPSHRILFTANILSEDYMFDPNAQACGSAGAVVSGKQIAFAISKTDEPGDSVSSILDGTFSSKSAYSQQKELDVDGVRGVEYLSRYEGPGQMSARFDRDGYSYNFGIDEGCDEGLSVEDLETFRKVVASLKFPQGN